MPDVHAKLSASGAKKWINCPASVTLESGFPDTVSAYAAEGTAAHTLGEAKLRLATNQITRVQYHKLIKDLEITEDMEEYTDTYRDYVLERYNALKGEFPDTTIQLEQLLNFSEWVPGGFGTGDAVIIGGDTVEIIDLKFGKGIRISAAQNPQLRLYALGAVSEYGFLFDIQKIRTTIFQPRLDNIDTEELTYEELLAWGKEIVPKAVLADKGSEKCHAGRHCDDGFCKARPICRAYAEEKCRLAAKEFKPPAELSIDEIAEIIDQSERLATWAKLVKDYALDQAVNKGISYPGFKVVEGRSNRKYAVPDEEIAKVLTKEGYSEQDIYKKELLGISKMEALLSKNKFNEILGGYVIKPQGKPTLVPAEDKRPEINTAEKAAEDFKDTIEKESK